jgi:glycosyltransferase involved in cell wall biosynthesis
VLTVLMATRNRARSLEQVLDSYTRLTGPAGGWRLVIIDNGSEDSTPNVVRGFAGRLPVTYVSEPLPGKSRALNTGLEHATGSLVLFTDDDILPCADWLTEYAAAADSQPDFDVFGGPVRAKWPFDPPSWAVCDGRVKTVCFMETEQTRASGPTDTWMTGQNMAIRSSALTPDRRFDINMGPGAARPSMGEEIELVGRLARGGHKIWWIAGARVEHIVRPEQLTKRWVLRRAVQFGRGRYWLDIEFRQPVPRVAGMPRWLLRRAIEQLGRAAAAWIRHNEQGFLVERWNLGYSRGVLSEAWRLRNETNPGPN